MATLSSLPWPSVDIGSLPVVSYRIISDDNTDNTTNNTTTTITNNSNIGSALVDDDDVLKHLWRRNTPFRRPIHFLYHDIYATTSSTTSSTSTSVPHYELDDADDALLTHLQCAPSVLETALDALEFAWFAKYTASNRATDRDVGLEFASADDDLCAACDNGDASDENQIVYCDACNVPLHLHCYGLDTLPSGRWECDPCRLADVEVRARIQCALCKRRRSQDQFLDAWRRISRGSSNDDDNNNDNNDDRWVHVACVLWIPESFVEDTPGHPINIESVLSDRFSLKCVICQKYGGACIQCTFSERCSTSFHVPCARSRFYELDIAEAVANCDRHRQHDVEPIARYPPASGTAGARRAARLPTLKKTVSAATNEPPLLSRTAALDALADAFGGREAPAMQHADRFIEHWRQQRKARGGLPLRATDDDDILNQSHKAAFLEVCKAGYDAVQDVYDGLRQLRRDLGRAEQLLSLVRDRELLKAKRLDVQAREIDCYISPLAAAHAFFVERVHRDDDVIVAAPAFPHNCALANVRTFDVCALSSPAEAAATSGDALVLAVLAQVDGVRCRPEDAFRYNVANVEQARSIVVALALDGSSAPSLRRHLSAEFVAAHSSTATTTEVPAAEPMNEQ
jgi:hypothetical protein